MSGVVEQAAGTRAPARSSPFPAEWTERQPPPADPVALAAWIAVNVRGRPLLPGVEIRDATARPAKTDPRVARLELLRRREMT